MKIGFQAAVASAPALRQQQAAQSKAPSALAGVALGRFDRGPALSERMKLQMQQIKAPSDVGEPTSILDVAEAALDEVQGHLGSMKGLAERALAMGDEYDPDREAINREYQSRLDDIDGVTKNTTFNGKRVFQTSDEARGKLRLSSDELSSYLDGLEAATAGTSSSAERRALTEQYTKEFADKLSKNSNRETVIGGYAIDVGEGRVPRLNPTLDRESLGLEGSNLLTHKAAKEAHAAIGAASSAVENMRWELRSAWARFDAASGALSQGEQVWADAITQLDAEQARASLRSTRSEMLSFPTRMNGLHSGLNAQKTTALLGLSS